MKEGRKTMSNTELNRKFTKRKTVQLRKQWYAVTKPCCQCLAGEKDFGCCRHVAGKCTQCINWTKLEHKKKLNNENN